MSFGFQIVTAPTVEPVSLSEAKLRLRIDSSEYDEEIEECIIAAREEAEHLMERSCARQVVRMSFDAFPSDIPLWMGPLVSVVSLTYVASDGVLTTLDPERYAVSTTRSVPWILTASGYDWPETADVADAVQVTYEVGHTPDDCPRQIKRFIIARVGALLRDKESDTDKPSQPNRHIYRLLDRYTIQWVEY